MNKKILILLVSLVLLGSSCTKFLGVDEVNPNNASAVPPKLLLPAALNNLALVMDNPRYFEFCYLWFGQWSISSGYSQPLTLLQYQLYNNSYQASWSILYPIGQNLTVMQNAATDPNDAGYVAIAMILKAYIMQNLVDIWGNVPYTQAFGATAGILKPKYDDQKAIYENLEVKLTAAINIINYLTVNANAIPASSDIMFGGDMTKWAKFGNTLKLRLLMHQAGMANRGTYIKSCIDSTSSTGYLGAGQGALVNPGYNASAGEMNPFYQVFYSASATQVADAATYYYAGKDAVDFLVANSDPRLSHYFGAPSGGGAYAGNYMGQDVVTHTPLGPKNTSILGYNASATTGMYYMIGSPTQSAPILTDFESLFIQAEAALRGYSTADPSALYASAVTQSCAYYGLTAAAATYLALPNPQVNYVNATNKLTLVLTQKWIAMNGIAPIEIWTDWRRTGIPATLHFSENANKANATPPVRLLYPQTEISSNNANVLAVGTINAFTSKIFWQP